MSLKITISLLAILVIVIAEFESLNSSISGVEVESTILSRRKRFLIFPDGSSFQLVFCAQNQGYLQIGDIVWFGNTAALAWELPADPAIFSPLRSGLRDPLLRRQDGNKHIYLLDEAGKLIAKVPYKRKPIVNPAFAKRSIQNKEDGNISIKNQVFIKKMHELQKSRSYLHNLDEASAHFHRSGRHSLYKKLETLFEGFWTQVSGIFLLTILDPESFLIDGMVGRGVSGLTLARIPPEALGKSRLGYSGHECILRMLCEAGKAKLRDQQGTFLEEIFRATFTFPKGAAIKGSLDYDEAHNTDKDCAQLYPECEDLRTSHKHNLS